MALYKNLSATAQVKVGAARLVSLTVNSTSSGTIVIYDDGAKGTNNKVLNTLTPAAGTHMFWGDDGLALDNGMYVVIGSTLDVTIGYK